MRRDVHKPERATSPSSLGGDTEEQAKKPERWNPTTRSLVLVAGCLLVGLGDWVVGGFQSLLALLAVACMAGGVEYGIRRSRRL